MADWPGISPPSEDGFEETTYKPKVRTETEANYTIVRPKVSRARKRWKLSWPLMTEADYQLLDAFFNQYQGSSFTWQHPVTSTNYTCVFSGDSLTSSFVVTGYRSVSCDIEEL